MVIITIVLSAFQKHFFLVFAPFTIFLALNATGSFCIKIIILCISIIIICIATYHKHSCLPTVLNHLVFWIYSSDVIPPNRHHIPCIRHYLFWSVSASFTADLTVIMIFSSACFLIRPKNKVCSLLI